MQGGAEGLPMPRTRGGPDSRRSRRAAMIKKATLKRRFLMGIELFRREIKRSS
jgi:hypothetical protein